MEASFVQKLIHDISVSPHRLERTPESSGPMEEETSVDNFNEVMKTNVTINYAAGLDYIHRARGGAAESALDLCSGPGHYTMCLQRYLGYKKLMGVDLSEGMLENARENTRGLGSFSFRAGNAVQLRPENFVHEVGQFDLVSCANAAHHLDSIHDVQKMVTFADRVAKPDGLVIVTDLCRLPNQDVSDRFISMIGDDYVNNGLHSLAADFRASMHAAWAPDELARAVPENSDRRWFQIVAGGLPFFQALIGLPVGRKDLFVRESKDWIASGIHQTERSLADWDLTKDNYYAGMIREINSL